MKYFLILGITLALAPVNFADAKDLTECKIVYNLSSWSVFYKKGKGDGSITCDNGQSRKVKITTHGGGFTFGKSEIDNGKGKFSKVRTIEETFGGYAAADAHAGVSESAQAFVVTKGSISLALSGTGRGIDVGFSFGSFNIQPAEK